MTSLTYYIMPDFWLITTFASNFGISFVGHRYKDKPFTRVENIVHSSTFACEQKRKVAILKQQYYLNLLILSSAIDLLLYNNLPNSDSKRSFGHEELTP